MRQRRFTAMFFVCLLSAGSALAQDQKLTAEQIIQKHLDAVGGQEALAKLKTRIAIGTIKKDSEPEGQLAIMSEPQRLSVFYGFRDFDLQMIYDGKESIIRPVLPRNVTPIKEKFHEMLASGLMFNGISLYNLITNGVDDQLKIEAKGTKRLNNRPAYAVQIKTSKGATMKAYFDEETFMWVRTEYGQASVSKEIRTFTNDVVNQGGSEATVDFFIETSDFREVDGVKLPFKFEQVMTAPILRRHSIGTVVGMLREYRHNIAIDPSMFK